MSTEATSSTGRREQILAAARDVLAEHGYERTTVSQIAARARIAQGTFYLYFPSKESLPGALAGELAALMGEAARCAAQVDGGLDEAVGALVDESIDVAEGRRDVLSISNRGIELETDFAAWAELVAPWRAGIEDFVRARQARGEVDRALDVPTVALVVRDLVDRAAKAAVLFGRPEYAAATATLVRRALAG